MPFTKLKGRDLTLIDVIYQRASKKTDWKDYLTVVYKDNLKDTKERFIIEEPTITLFVVKPEYRTFKKQRHFITMDKVDPVEVKYKGVKSFIAKEWGPQIYEQFKAADYKDKKKIFKYPYVMGGDIDIETYYRTIWSEQIGFPDKTNLTKIFLDIEVDQIDYKGNIARHGECEVNAITVGDDKTNTFHTFLYDNGKNEQIQEFVAHQKEFQKRVHEEFDERNGIFDYNIYMFENEAEMIIQVFRLINSLQRDFCLIWNMGFDIPYLIDRLYNLGINAESVMCSMDFPTQTLYYYEDKDTFEWANKRDYFSISSNTHFSDQLINYAALRKSQGAVKKVNLDAIAAKEQVPGKVTYKSVATIRTLPYVDYILFVLYNIGDVLTQLMIERKTKDLENLYLISSTNNIGYTDALKQTVTFRGLLYGYLKKRGMVLGHNVNFDNTDGGKYDENGERVYRDEDNEDDEDDSFEGAINGDPLLNIANGLSIYRTASKYLYGLTIDFDFSSMYPNSIVAFNIFATTMIGKLYIFKFDLENPYDDDKGKEYIEDIIAGDLDHIGRKWHNLSGIEDLALKVMQYKEKNG